MNFCQKQKIIAGLAPPETTIEEETKDIINKLAKEDVSKKVEDGKLERALSKREREEQNVISFGGKKGGKKNKK